MARPNGDRDRPLRCLYDISLVFCLDGSSWLGCSDLRFARLDRALVPGGGGWLSMLLVADE